MSTCVINVNSSSFRVNSQQPSRNPGHKQTMSRRGQQFLFINKDSSSDTLSRSQASEKRTILSHVQNKRRTKEAATHAEPWSGDSALVTIRHGSYLSRDESSLQEQMEGSRKSLQFARASSSPARLPLVFPSNNAADPFHATVVGTAAGNHALLRCTYGFTTTIFLTEAYAPKQIAARRRTMRHAVTLEKRMQRCVEDNMLMNSTLAYGLCTQGWSQGRMDSYKPPEHYIGETIREVRNALSQPDLEVDIWLLLSVYSLALTGFWVSTPAIWSKCPERYAHALRASEDSLHTARMHMNAFLQLVDKAGGWENVDPYVMEGALLGEMYMSITLMRPPAIPVTWDPNPVPPFSVPVEDQSSSPRLGAGFRSLEGYISTDLTNIVQDAAGYVRVATAFWLNRAAEVTPKDETWLFLRLRAIMFRLLGHPSGRYDDCIRIASLVFFCNTIAYHGAYSAARTLIAYLKPALEKIPEDDDILDIRTRIWCLCMGAMTSESSAERDWFTGMAAGYVIDRLTEKELREILEEHLFLFSTQEAEFNDMMRRMSLPRGV